MKRIILGLSLLLMLVQNGFAREYTEVEYDKAIANEPDKYWKQSYKCDKVALHHPDTGDVNECLKSIALQKKNPNGRLNIAITYMNIGVLYERSEKNYIKAYEYYMKSAKLGSTKAQKNLDNLCSDHSWVCK